MAETKKVTYLNLLDKIIPIEIKGKLNGDEIFRKLLLEYFFSGECGEKKVLNLVKGLEFPSFFSESRSLLDIDQNEIDEFIKGSLPVDSLAGMVFMSKQYLQIFYRDCPPEIAKMPEDVRCTLMEEVNKRNGQIIYSFHKMREDLEIDRKRTVGLLVALIFRNINFKIGLHYSEIIRPADEIIGGIFHTAGSVYTGTADQNGELCDDLHIKSLVKAFCVIRKNSELSEIASLFKAEAERYKIRAEYLSKKI